MNKYLITIVVLFMFCQSCYKEKLIYNSDLYQNLQQPLIFKLNNKHCAFDLENNSLRYSISTNQIINFSPYIQFQEYSKVYFKEKLLKNNSINNLGNIDLDSEYEITLTSNNETKQLLLSFTNLPIVQIISAQKINDEPKNIAKIIINPSDETELQDEYIIGIEIRGGYSSSLNKKSYGFSLKENIDNNNISSSILNMKPNNDWILDAMYIDKSRLRNKTAFQLWNKMNDSNNYGISGEFVELYLNNNLQGIYSLNENINSEFINLTDNDAVLYKATAWENGATKFEILSNNISSNYYWDGWEQKYPNPKHNINWNPLAQLRELVVNKNNTEFSSKVSDLIDIDNFIDYYIFLNMLKAMDNTGKNTFLARKTSSDKLFIIPWDLDATSGIFWDGTHFSHTGILTNKLYERLLETNTGNFKNKLKNRWLFLRSNSFSNFNLTEDFIENFETLKISNILTIENNKWETDINIDNEQSFLIDWLEKRAIFLDEYFTNL